MRIIPPCPCARCARRHRRNQTDMSEHLRTHEYMPNFDMPPINIADQDHGREEVMRQRIDGYEDDEVRDMLKGWEVVFKVSPHGKLPNPNEDDYYNINPMTYEGVFYQEQPDDDDDDVVRNDDARPLGDDDVDPNVDDARNDGETIVNENDILMLEKLNEDADDEEEPPPPSDNEDDMIDSDDETDRERGYNSDDSYGF